MTLVLTADLCARAMIAAAQVFSTDPLAAMAAPARSRLLTPRVAAASAIAKAGVCSVAVAARTFDLAPQSIFSGRSKAARPGGPGGYAPDVAVSFLAAETAAARAVSYVAWKPDARASVLAGEAVEEIEEPRPVEETRLQAPAAPSMDAPALPPVRRGPAPGRVTSWFAAPAPGFASSLQPIERPLGDRILDILQDGSATTMGIASILGAKESLVSQSLSALRHQGLVESAAVPPEGIRHQRWSQAQRAAA